MIQTRHPPSVSCDVGAESYFKEWLRSIEDDTMAVAFKYDRGCDKFPIKTLAEQRSNSYPMSHPTIPEGTDDLRTLISLDLLQSAIAPTCIDGDVKFAFGNDTPLYIGTQVTGCDVAMAIAPRIES